MYNDENITVKGGRVFIKNKGYLVEIEKSNCLKIFELLEELRCDFNMKGWDRYLEGDPFYARDGSVYKVKGMDRQSKSLALISLN